jgi:hypothetical protein
MLSYETLDRIADAHNPLLGLLWITLVMRALASRRWRTGAYRALTGLYTLVVAYGMEHVDIATGTWPRLGLDYSTHTAVAMAMVATLWAISRVGGWLAVATFALYVPLMLHQGYHGPGDILTTTLAVGALTFPLAWRVRRSLLARARPIAAPPAADAAA